MLECFIIITNDNVSKVGTLTLEISGIQYQCADDPSKSFSATLGNVTLDDDGVKVGPKEKHHFKNTECRQQGRGPSASLELAAESDLGRPEPGLGVNRPRR